MDLKELVALWQKTRDPRVAVLVDLVAPPPGEPVAGGRKKAEHEGWLSVAANAKKKPEELGRLLPTMTAATSQLAAERLEALPDDPRLASALVGVFAKPPYTAGTTKEFWRAAGARLAALGDARHVDTLADLESRYLSIVTTQMGILIRGELRKAIEALRAAKPKPIPPKDLEAIVALEQEHAGSLASTKSTTAKAAGGRKTEAELLSDVYAAPDDDGPRLVYADWLVEKEDPRGEFIQLQVRRDPATRERERELLDQHGREWEKVITAAAAYVQFARGFPSHTLGLGSKAGFAKMSDSPAWSTVVAASFAGAYQYRKDLEKKVLKVLSPSVTRGLKIVEGIWPEALLATDRPWEGVHLITAEKDDALLTHLATLPLRELGYYVTPGKKLDWLLEPFAGKLERFVSDGHALPETFASVDRTTIPRLDFITTGGCASFTRDASGKLRVLRLGPGTFGRYVNTRFAAATLEQIAPKDLTELHLEVPYERDYPLKNRDEWLAPIRDAAKSFPRARIIGLD